MTVVSQARVPTPHARKYALQLGRHWQHNLAVEESGDMRRITFPRDARGAAWSGEALRYVRAPTAHAETIISLTILAGTVG